MLRLNIFRSDYPLYLIFVLWLGFNPVSGIHRLCAVAPLNNHAQRRGSGVAWLIFHCLGDLRRRLANYPAAFSQRTSRPRLSVFGTQLCQRTSAPISFAPDTAGSLFVALGCPICASTSTGVLRRTLYTRAHLPSSTPGPCSSTLALQGCSSRSRLCPHQECIGSALLALLLHRKYRGACSSPGALTRLITLNNPSLVGAFIWRPRPKINCRHRAWFAPTWCDPFAQSGKSQNRQKGPDHV